MSDNTTRPATAGGDVIRSEDESADKAQAFRLRGGRSSLIDTSGRPFVTGAQAVRMLESLRDTKRARLQLLKEMRAGALEGSGASVFFPLVNAPFTTVSDILGAREKRSYGVNVTNSQWTDDLGIANAVQGTAVNQPTITTVPKGRPAVSFSPDGSFGANADFFQATATGASSTPEFTAICFCLNVAVGYTNDASGGADIIDISGRAVVAITTTDNLLRTIGLGNKSLAHSNAVINDGLWHAIVGIVDTGGGGLGTLAVDGVLQTQDVPATDGGVVDLSVSNIFFGTQDATGVVAAQAQIARVSIAQSTSAFTSWDISQLSDALTRYIVQ